MPENAAKSASSPAPASAPATGGRPWMAIIEFALVGFIFYADYRHWIPFSKTPELLLLGWISLRLRGLRWRDVGLTRYRAWLQTIAIGVVVGALLETFALLVTQPVLTKFFGRQPDLELFRMLTGNLRMTALFIVLAWALAGLGEEMFWRGYLMNRVADLLGRKTASWIVSLIVVSFVFGWAHSYQGLTGIVEEGFAGLLLGLIYLGTGRNLWVPIIAHGVADTIDMVLIYYGKMPGT